MYLSGLTNWISSGKEIYFLPEKACPPYSTLSKKILNELEKEGQNVRKYYQLRLPSNPSRDYYFMHRDTPNNETVIVEYGFIDSPKDDVEQIKKNYKEYAEAVVRAVADYKGIKYTAPLGSDYYTVKKGDTLITGILL